MNQTKHIQEIQNNVVQPCWKIGFVPVKDITPRTYAKLLEILNNIPEVTGFTKIIQQSLENEGILIGMYVLCIILLCTKCLVCDSA